MPRTTEPRAESVPAPATTPDPPPVNEVRLVGRVSKPAVEREMPSGDLLVSFVCVVPRPSTRRATVGRGPTHDSLDCVTWSAATRRAALRLQSGDVVEVHGALRRRFWGVGSVRSSRYEVEAATLRRLARG